MTSRSNRQDKAAPSVVTYGSEANAHLATLAGRRRRLSGTINTNSERDTSSNALLGRARICSGPDNWVILAMYRTLRICFHMLDKIPSSSTHGQPYDCLFQEMKNRLRHGLSSAPYTSLSFFGLISSGF